MTLPIHCLRQRHMATTFEIQIAHEDSAYARQASLAALQTAARLDLLLNRYREESEISQIRNLAEGESMRLHLDTFTCLRLAVEMQQITGGAFDPGLGAQIDLWRADAVIPSENNLCRPGQLILDPETFSARRLGSTINLDLGAIGKGFALDRMAEELVEWNITEALLIAGGSSIMALNVPNPGKATTWEITLADWHRVILRCGALSSSGKSVKGAHILDPRDGKSAKGPSRTWALTSSAAISDALSTAWMLLDPEQIQEVCRKLPGTQAILQLCEEKPSELVQINGEQTFPVQQDIQSYDGRGS